MSKCGDLLKAFEGYINIAQESGKLKFEGKPAADYEIEDPHQDIEDSSGVKTVDPETLDVTNKA